MLTSVTIPDSVVRLDEWAFGGCDSLKSVTIGKSVSHIGDNAFYGCEKLKKVYNLSSLRIAAGSKNYGEVALYAKKVYTTAPVKWPWQ